MNTLPPAKKASQKIADLQIAFDVGHSSIGWAVLQAGSRREDLQIKGTGAVIFRADDCLARKRRDYRRQRRHTRSTRQRIGRIKTLLNNLSVMTGNQLDKPGCAWPWQLAARVLADGKLLTWPELWDVLRWYAHNRGYDGNRRWSASEVDARDEDTEKEENARKLMEKYGSKSMAETFCRSLGVDPLKGKRSSIVRFKAFNAAFPREIVEDEVRHILRAHFAKLDKVDSKLERALIGRDGDDKLAWQSIPCIGLKLPKRYQGGLLFGQLVPRFDNRIIAICPVSGAKVPGRNCPEFLNFRWGMQLANVRTAGNNGTELRALHIDERKKLDEAMREHGSMTETEFKKAVRAATGGTRDNLETMLMHPDAKEALALDPVQKLIRSDRLAAVWPLLPERLQKRVRGKLRLGKPVTLAGLRADLLEQRCAPEDFDAVTMRLLDGENTKKRRKEKSLSREELLSERFQVRRHDGRAAYSRAVLAQAFNEVMAGKHPKEQGGVLYITDEMRHAQLNRKIDEQTNNHLVRHRLLILERVLEDIIKEFAGNDPGRIEKITIEVTRDLREMSGKTAKEIAQDLGKRIANHHSVAQKLEENEDLQKLLQKCGEHISPGLIRKARIAEDLNWSCPYTGQKYDPVQLATRYVDKDHIIPRSQRMSDALEAQVITFSVVNKWKGKRTALRFVEDEQGKPVPGMPNLSIMGVTRYRQLVDGLEAFKGHDDDKRRKRKRKQLLLLADYEEAEFLPRDLTATSQLVRLGAFALKKKFAGLSKPPTVISIPGSVTGTLRKGWNRNLLGSLSTANPQVIDEKGEIRTKTEIREITHLHHALDACVLGFAAHFIPNNGSIWELILKRKLDDTEKTQLRALGIFNSDSEGRFGLANLPDALEKQLRAKLAEKRIVQHIPARMDGLRVEQNTWRVVSEKDGDVMLQQRIRAADGTRPSAKEGKEKAGKLLGFAPKDGEGKLKKLKGVLIIPDNFGLALDPEPTIIPFHKVWTRLQDLKKRNGGKTPRVLKNGQIITVARGNFKGVWKIFSIKNNATGMALDIGRPDVVKLLNKMDGHKINVRLATLIRDGLSSEKYRLTGLDDHEAPGS